MAAGRLARRAKRASLTRVERSETRVPGRAKKNREFLHPQSGDPQSVTRNRWHARNRGRTRNRYVLVILARRGPFAVKKYENSRRSVRRRARISSTERLRVRPRLRACQRLRVNDCGSPDCGRKKSKLCDVVAPKRLDRSARYLVATTTRRAPASCASFVALAAKQFFSTCPDFHRLRACQRLRVAFGSASSSVFCVPHENGSIDFFQIWHAPWDRTCLPAREI